MFDERHAVIVADYSANRLTGAQLKAAGFGGAIRYAGLSESNIKITNLTEVNSILAAGLSVALVYELGLTDTSGGYNAGVANASALKSHAQRLGLPARGFLAQDQHIPAGQSSNVLAYFQGAASVLGAANTGVYGFYDTMDLTRQLGLGAYWQCGAHSDLRSWASVYQRNYGTYSAGGVACDANDIIAADWLQTPSPTQPLNEDEMAYIICDALNVAGELSGGILTGYDAASRSANEPSLAASQKRYVTTAVWNNMVAKSSALEALGAKIDAVTTAVGAIPPGTVHLAGDVPVTGSLHLGA